jgi:vacuolar-type H+-ATPase subunit B/Vma2
MKRLDAPIARTYSGAASAAGPLLFVRSTRRAKLGEWVRIVDKRTDGARSST